MSPDPRRAFDTVSLMSWPLMRLRGEVSHACPVVIITGMAGSGKSTFARHLARKINFAFIELDKTSVDADECQELHTLYFEDAPKLLKNKRINIRSIKSARNIAEAASAPGIVLAFGSDLPLPTRVLRSLEAVNVHVRILFGPGLCLHSFLKREEKNGRGLTHVIPSAKNNLSLLRQIDNASDADAKFFLATQKSDGVFLGLDAIFENSKLGLPDQ